MVNKQDSNNVVTSIGEQVALGTLASKVYVIEPNSFGDTGANAQLVTRSFIGSRKRQRGTIGGVDSKAGFQLDYTKTNMLRWLRGFFLNNYVAQFSTAPMDGSAIAITSVSATTFAATGGGLTFLTKQIILASGFTNAANNGLFVVGATPTGTSITVAGYNGVAPVVEASPPATAKLEVVGVRFASADIVISAAGTLTSTAFDFTTLGIQVGSWLFMGGDIAGSNYTGQLPTFIHVSAIAAHLLTFDKANASISGSTGVGISLELWFPTRTIIDPASNAEVLRYYTLERQLGNDGVGIQSSVIQDMLANEITWNLPQKEKITNDLAYLAFDETTLTGTQGLTSFATRNAALGEDAYNTSSDVVRMKMQLVTAGNLSPTPLAAYLTTLTLKMTNGGTVNTAIGTPSGFDYDLGEFDVSGNVDAYFTSISAIQAVRTKADVTLDAIICSRNAGWFFDIPLVELDNSSLKIEKNKPISIPLTSMGVQNSNGYVMMYGYYSWLPTIAMPPNAS